MNKAFRGFGAVGTMPHLSVMQRGPSMDNLYASVPSASQREGAIPPQRGVTGFRTVRLGSTAILAYTYNE